MHVMVMSCVILLSRWEAVRRNFSAYRRAGAIARDGHALTQSPQPMQAVQSGSASGEHGSAKTCSGQTSMQLVQGFRVCMRFMHSSLFSAG